MQVNIFCLLLQLLRLFVVRTILLLLFSGFCFCDRAFSLTCYNGKLSLHAVLVGALNDRLLLANPTEASPRQKKGIEIKNCLVGLLEPLLIGFATMQQYFEQKLDLSETLYQITSRFSFKCFNLCGILILI